MKNKIPLLFLYACLFSSPGYSQGVFGFRAGMQLARMTGVEDFPKTLLPTVQVKGVAILPLSDEVTINPSLGYSGKGYKWNNLTFEDPFGSGLITGDVIGLFHYLQLTVPISYKIAPDQNHEYYIGAGPYFSYAVDGKAKVKNAPTLYESWDLFISDAYKKTDAGIAIEIAGKLKRKFLIAFNADIGLADVSNKGGGKLKQLAAGLSFGYLFQRKS